MSHQASQQLKPTSQRIPGQAKANLRSKGKDERQMVSSPTPHEKYYGNVVGKSKTGAGTCSGASK
jgi:hypothetical protein